jgi:hypothetical protein
MIFYSVSPECFGYTFVSSELTTFEMVREFVILLSFAEQDCWQFTVTVNRAVTIKMKLKYTV